MKKNKSPLHPVSVLVLCLLVSSNLTAFKATGAKLSFYITNDLLYQNNRLANEKNQFYESLTLFANYDKWSLGLTLRGNNFFKQTPNRSLKELQTDIYRKYIQYDSAHLKVTVGDFYSLLGRGMVLSVLKNEDILRERTILGGDVRYNKGRFDFRALGGRIKDETNDQEWTVAGGEAAAEVIKNHTLGVHLSYIDDIETRRNLGQRLTYSFSLKGNKLFKYFSYYSEAAFLKFRQASQENGYGIYSNVTFSKSRVTCSLEFKRFKDFDNQVNNPPIADREDEISSVNDTTGVRFLFQYAVPEPDIILFVNAGRYEEYGKTGNHIYAGFEMEDLMDRLSLSASYGIRNVLYSIKRLESDLVYQITDRWSCEAGYKNRWYKDGLFVFKEIDHTFQVSYSPYISLFFLHQYSHNRVIGLNHFYSGGVKLYLAGGTAVQLSGGTVRGGQICSGGQCYIAPPFKGIKFSVLHSFR